MIQALWSLDQQFQNKNGSILTHGKIYVYYSGRTALATTYNDEDGTVVNPNPIILDNNGRAACFASSMYAYTVVVCDAYGKELFSYNITLHDAIGTAEKVFVIGSDGSVQVETTTLPNGVQYDLSVNTDIIATKELVENVSSTIQSKLDKKKDLQEVKSYSGSKTKTITNLSQDANGVITVNYEDIDLPSEVPNVEITSPNGTIDVHSSTDVQTNTKTFTIDVNKGAVPYAISNGSITFKAGSYYTDGKVSLSNIKSNNIQYANNKDGWVLKKDHVYVITYNIIASTQGPSNEAIGGRIWLDGFIESDQVWKFVLDSSFVHDESLVGSAIVCTNQDGEVHLNMRYDNNNLKSIPLANINKVEIVDITSIVGQGSGDVSVSHDNTLSGAGTLDSPLGVVAQALYTAGILDVQYVNQLPASPTSGVLYLIPES